MLSIPKISVIVPIYNMERLLKRALDSVLAQTFVGWECLLIDDGSTDDSPQICDEYAKKDSRFRVFHKKNGGVSSARQCGIDNALGEYTIHVDPDDWIDCDMLESLLHSAETNDADMVICDFMIEKKSGSHYNNQKPISLNHFEIMKQLLLMKLHGSCCNKLIKRSCYERNNVYFPKEMIMWEDMFVCCRILQENVRVVYLSKAFYHYDCFSNASSIVRNSSRKKIESKKFLIKYFENLYADKIDFYNVKKDVKMGLLRLNGVKKKEIVSTYENMNESIISNTKYSIRQPLANALKFVLNGGNLELSLLLLKIHCHILSILSFIKRLVKSLKGF